MHLTRWGPEARAGLPPVLLLHGWQDTGDTFQFMVDAFREDWPLVAPDWRGFGRSGWSQDGYWFPDYYADLDALVDWLSPDEPVQLVGHSMGGNIAGMYAGLRPRRVRCVANLEGFGLGRIAPDQVVDTTRKWLDQVRSVPPLKDYESFEQLASIIAFRYPRFPAERTEFIARAWAAHSPDGRVRLLGDSRHRWVSPVVYRREETEAVWRRIEAPMLLLLGVASEYLERLGADGTDAAFQALIARLEIVRIPDAGHMLHIEKTGVGGARRRAIFERPPAWGGLSTADMDVSKPPPVDLPRGRPNAGAAPTLSSRSAPLAPGALPVETSGATAVAALADAVHIHPLDLDGALQIMIAEVRAELPLPGDTAPSVALPLGVPLPPVLPAGLPLPPGVPPLAPATAMPLPLAPQTLVQLFLQSLPPPDAQEPAAWLASVVQAEGAMQVALDRAIRAASVWRDVPAAVLDGVHETRDVVLAAITDDPPNPLWLRPEWLGLAPRMQEYRRRRRRAHRWLSDPDLQWREPEHEPARRPTGDEP